MLPPFASNALARSTIRQANVPFLHSVSQCRHRAPNPVHKSASHEPRPATPDLRPPRTDVLRTLDFCVRLRRWVFLSSRDDDEMYVLALREQIHRVYGLTTKDGRVVHAPGAKPTGRNDVEGHLFAQMMLETVDLYERKRGMTMFLKSSGSLS